jgi:membrane protease YdiL (CAAX protease family)
MKRISQPEDQNLVLFYIITIAFTWFFWISEVLAMQGRLGSSIFTDFLLSPNNPAAWGPLIGAVVLTYWKTRKEGVIKLLKRGVDYRFAKVWWIPIILFWPAIMGGGLLAALLAGEEIPTLFWVANPLLIGSSFVLILLFQGPLQEEFGWRGYALDRLQARFNALISSIILGLMWVIWHLPYMFWLSDEVIYEVFWGFLLSNILITIVFTWLFNNTGGSVMVTLINHAMFILAVIMFPALETATGSLFYLIVLIASIVAIVLIWGPKQLMRESKEQEISIKEEI